MKHSSSDGIEGSASEEAQLFIAPNLNGGNCSCVVLLRGIVFVENPLSLVRAGRGNCGFLRLLIRLEINHSAFMQLSLTRSTGLSSQALPPWRCDIQAVHSFVV